MTNNTKKIFIGLLLFTGIMFVFFQYSPIHVSFVLSESVNPKLIFWAEVNNHIIGKSDYIIVKWDKDNDVMGLKKGQFLTKKVFCSPRMTLKREVNQFYCNDSPSNIIKEHSRNGTLLQAFDYNGELNSTSYFVEGDNPFSYDSKYFGLVDRDQIVGIVMFYI